MRVLWTRSKEKISFDRPSTWFSLGLRGTGKSSLLEHIAENYLAQGHVCFDLFGSRDGENLAWLRSPHAQDKKILLLHGENVTVESSFPTKCCDAATLEDFEKYDIIISSSPLYLNVDQEFLAAAKLTDLLYKRHHYKRLVILLCREAANFYYSRLKISDSQIFAKSQMIYLIREARHMGLAPGLDSIRYYAIDIDIRNLCDYLILKAQGVQGLANDLRWLYSYFDAATVRSMPPQNFFIISKTGALGLGSFPMPAWHKQEKEDILKNVGIEVTYGEVLKTSQDKGAFRTVSDKEHEQIIKLYVEGMSYESIATQLGRSSRTPLQHVRYHNGDVERNGYCLSCKRCGSIFQDRLAQKPIVSQAL